jgi:hypothetical protein
MTDAAISEMPVEPVPPVPPVPEAIAEVDGAPLQAPEAVASAEALDLSSPNLASAKAELEGAAQTPAERALPFADADVEHLGVLRRSVLDALADADEPLSVARIIQEFAIRNDQEQRRDRRQARARGR